MARARKQREPWSEAIAHLRRVDPYCAAAIDRVGPCRLEPRADRFGTLVRAIIGQQISTKAAASIDRRLREIGGEPHDPAVLLQLGEDALRGVGLSGVKARYVLNLAGAVAAGDAPLDEFDDWDDEAIIARLTSIKGVGRWTAEMFLIFALNRPDVLPVADLGIRVALRDRHGLPELPKPAECPALAEHLRPYRTIAMWYFWRDLGNPRPAMAPPIPLKAGDGKRAKFA
jgi:DNA-3-methyladenine glycosylase II